MTSPPEDDAGLSQIPLRLPDQVMRLSRMGAAFPTRLSFMRILIRKLSTERAQVKRPVWQIDCEGYGRAVYSVQLEGRSYSLVAFSTALEPERRTDRVIAQAWHVKPAKTPWRANPTCHAQHHGRR